jgi:hypothetical protein
VIETRRTGVTEAGKVSEAGLTAITEYRAMGKAAWLAANPEPQPVATEPQPEPQPVATEPQPAAVAFSDVATVPSGQVIRFEVIDGGLANQPTQQPAPVAIAPLTQMGQVGSQILATNQSAAAAVGAVSQMIGAMKARLTTGIDHLHAQDRQSAAIVEQLETGLVELQTLAYEHDRLARVQAIRQQLRDDRVGKLTAEMEQTAALSGFQLARSS